MKRSILVACATLMMAGLPAAHAAQPAPAIGPPQMPDGECNLPESVRNALSAQLAQGELPRAAVRADVAVWRASGMSQLSRARPLPDVYSERYREHYATYLRMRGGPEFAAAFCQALRDAQ